MRRRRGCAAVCVARSRFPQQEVSMRLANVFVISAILSLIVSATGSAQTPAATQPAPPPSTPVAGWQDGFFLQTTDGNNRLTLGLTVQVDGRFSADAPTPFPDTFTIRKLRPTFTGRVGRYFDFKAMPDFG